MLLQFLIEAVVLASLGGVIGVVLATGASMALGQLMQVPYVFQPGINLLTEVIPTKNILFASEMIGAVRGIDPQTGHYYDDTKRYIEATQNLTADEKHAVYEGNARRVFTRLDSALKAKGL